MVLEEGRRGCAIEAAAELAFLAGAATGTCDMFSWQVPGGLAPMTLLNTGVYVDPLAKAGGEWRFKTRALNLETLAPGIA